MSISDEQDLAERLGGALGEVTPCPAPLDAVLRKGRAIRAWRRIATRGGRRGGGGRSHRRGACLATGRVSAGTPGREQGASGGPPPGPGLPAGADRLGAAGGARWRATVRQAPQGLVGFCITVTPARPQCASAWYLTRSSPVNLTTMHGHGESATAGPVWHGVARVGVWLSDGTVLWLHPVAAYGLTGLAKRCPVPASDRAVAAWRCG